MEVDVFSRRSKSVAAIAAAALSVTFMTTSAPAANAAATKTIRVWLMPDAKNFGTALADTNAAFVKAHPGYKVAVEYQTWGDHLKKLDAALVARNTPDVVEFGNTEVLKYSASGSRVLPKLVPTTASCSPCRTTPVPAPLCTARRCSPPLA
jgi:N,N'-diacetylchitobiose transport system substrate-binding protein